ncbi:dopamine receptor 1-like [Gigantopelta aegis]|uniref:dopamine receptor 1-like n=1 Tax=Gigantopelta aegis TaxID=1735272 RepID=UPI001B88DFDD|nr:dopamine receptor 1-like [Gigantopelta aegis]XP_041369303.1 dopamine receptor 1-like [Gigantopelta aegis]
MQSNWTSPFYDVSTHSLALNVTSTTITNISSSSSDEDSGVYTLAEKVAIGTFLSIIIVLAIGGNLLVCAAVFTDRRLKRNTNFFIVSLAIADLLVAAFVMTFALVNDILGKWVLGAEFCKIWISSDIMCSTASILNLCVISLDRYIHIKDPLRYDNWMTRKKTVLFIAIVWILSALISFVPIHNGWHENSDGDTIASDECIFELNPIYAVVSSTISFYIPCIVMLSIYCKLYLYARRHVEVIKRTHTADRFQSDGTKVSYRVSDHKAAVTLGIIMGVFLLCWVPFFIINPIAAFCLTCIPPVVFKILTWLGYVNSCLNPIIYSIFNTEFRDAFRRIIFPKCLLEREKKKTLYGTNGNRKINKAEYGPPLMENGSTSSNQARKNSRERLFADRITSL